MKRKKRQKRSAKGKKSRNTVKQILGMVEAPQALPPELAEMFRPVKRPVTIRLDADILAFFQRGGRGYQTRMNEALRYSMTNRKNR
jgi:uncharacterized protein (DUF4415 family)